ncbi:hypothetical protein C0J52_23785 [Blattella germanica]|nr:hypothetical protein C0J52_23785 [Blattella germanica]
MLWVYFERYVFILLSAVCLHGLGLNLFIVVDSPRLHFFSLLTCSDYLFKHHTTHYCCFLIQFENILNRYCLSKCLYILLAPSVFNSAWAILYFYATTTYSNVLLSTNTELFILHVTLISFGICVLNISLVEVLK